MSVSTKIAKTLSTEERKKIPDSLFAGPNRSFPVPDKKHVQAARRLLGRYKGPGSKEAIKRKIEQRARELGMTEKSAALLGYEEGLKTSAFVATPQNSAVAPNPPKAGSVPSPTPAVSAPKIDTGLGSQGVGAPSSLGRATSTNSGGDSGGTKQASDSVAAGVAGGAGGALGGYLLGSKVIDPMIGRHADELERVLASGQKRLHNMRKAQLAAPLGAAAIGALVLATIAASRARKDEREKMINEQLMQQQYMNTPYLDQYNTTANEVLPFNRGFY